MQTDCAEPGCDHDMPTRKPSPAQLSAASLAALLARVGRPAHLTDRVVEQLDLDVLVSAVYAAGVFDGASGASPYVDDDSMRRAVASLGSPPAPLKLVVDNTGGDNA
jgi:hypothetical protein